MGKRGDGRRGKRNIAIAPRREIFTIGFLSDLIRFDQRSDLMILLKSDVDISINVI